MEWNSVVLVIILRYRLGPPPKVYQLHAWCCVESLWERLGWIIVSQAYPSLAQPSLWLGYPLLCSLSSSQLGSITADLHSWRHTSLTHLGASRLAEFGAECWLRQTVRQTSDQVITSPVQHLLTQAQFSLILGWFVIPLTGDGLTNNPTKSTLKNSTVGAALLPDESISKIKF